MRAQRGWWRAVGTLVVAAMGLPLLVGCRGGGLGKAQSVAVATGSSERGEVAQAPLPAREAERQLSLFMACESVFDIWMEVKADSAQLSHELQEPFEAFRLRQAVGLVAGHRLTRMGEALVPMVVQELKKWRSHAADGRGAEETSALAYVLDGLGPAGWRAYCRMNLRAEGAPPGDDQGAWIAFLRKRLDWYGEDVGEMDLAVGDLLWSLTGDDRVLRALAKKMDTSLAELLTVASELTEWDDAWLMRQVLFLAPPQGGSRAASCGNGPRRGIHRGQRGALLWRWLYAATVRLLSDSGSSSDSDPNHRKRTGSAGTGSS